MKIRSIRFKTSVLYSSILCVILACFSAYLFHTTRHILYEEIQQDLVVKAGQIDELLNAYAIISLNDNSPASLMKQFLFGSGVGATDKEAIDRMWIQDSKSLGLRKDFFRILGAQGAVILRSGDITNNIDRAFNAQILLHKNAVRFFDLRINGTAFYGINYPFRFAHRSTFVIQLAAPLASIQRILSKLEVFIIGGIAAILLLTFFMGAFLTEKVLKPVLDVTKAADAITQKNLNMRIPEQKLDHEMQELIESFNRMIERLEQSFTHVNEFSSHVAHELKTPLAIIKNELELTLSAGNMIEKDQRVLQGALQEIDRLIKTIKDLLLLAKLEYNLNIFKMEEMDLTDFLRDIYQHCKVLAAEKNISIELKIPDHPVRIQGDAVHLRRIFFNLAHNAVKFTPPGGKILIHAEVHDKKYLVSVQDTGIGIAPADQSRIFERFYRVRRLDQEDAGGNGLGLCMARTIARSHGGDITFKSELNKGSVFTVTLPILPK